MAEPLCPDVLLNHLYAEIFYDGYGNAPQKRVLLHFKDGHIHSIQTHIPPEKLPQGTLSTPIATAGFLDLQINGAGDVQFNADLSLQGLERMVAASAQSGATDILPTFITAPDCAYQQAVESVLAALSKGITGIAGIHLEGPFLSKERPGIHCPNYLRPLTDADVNYLCQAAQKLKILLTLAPECQDLEKLKRLNENGVVLFAGHSNATYEDMQRAAKVGLKGVTHLFNAMSQTTGREPGLVGSVLGTNHFFAGIIADGYHVHPANLTLATRAIPERLCLVTDAMQTMNGSSTEFSLYGKHITLKQGRLTGEDGTLGGAHITMAEAITRICILTGTPLEKAIMMSSHNPAKAIGLDKKIGGQRKNKAINLALFDSNFQCNAIIRKGKIYDYSVF